MSKRDRRDDRGRDRDRDRDRDRRDSQPDDEGQRRSGEVDIQEGESLTALKAILSKVSALLNPLQLTPEESIRLVEQLYGGVLAMDVLLAGEADDTRKQSVLAHIQNTTVTRQGDKIAVEYPSARKVAPEAAPAETPSETTGETPREAMMDAPSTPPDAPRPAKPRPAAAARPSAGRRKPVSEATPPTEQPQEPRTSEPTSPDSSLPEN